MPWGLFPDEFVTQDFTAQESGVLSRAELFLGRTPGTEGPFNVSIQRVNSNREPNGVVLASGQIPASKVSNGPAALVGVTFTVSAPVVAGERYAIVVSRSVASWEVGVREDPGGADCPGRFMYFELFVGSLPEQPTMDLVFRVFVNAQVFFCKGQEATHFGTDGANTIFGTPGRDVIAALAGNDRVLGLGGNDVICGNRGRDALLGHKGKDKLFGQAAKDILKGGLGIDVLRGGPRSDLLRGGRSNDLCFGGSGNDLLRSC